MYSLYLDTGKGASLESFWDVLNQLYPDNLSAKAVNDWLRANFLQQKKINWLESPLSSQNQLTINELLDTGLLTQDDQIFLALILTVLQESGLEGFYFSALPISADPQGLSLLEGEVVIFNGFTATPSFILLAKKLGTPAEPGRQGILRRWARSKTLPALTAYLIESASNSEDQVVVIKFQVDDMNPEVIGFLQGQALELGALDFFVTPIQMKKNRPGSLITILTPLENKDTLLDLIFRETTTIGVRYHQENRVKAARRIIQVTTPYGSVQVKRSIWTDSRGQTYVQNSPEFEDCKRLALQKGIPLKKIYESVWLEAAKLE